ncbi:MAG: GNAT family N-acetyltransferase, partial [Oscillospiraceae bacterium]
RYWLDGFSDEDHEVARLTGSRTDFTHDEVISAFLSHIKDTDRFDLLIVSPDGRILGESVINEIDWNDRSANYRIAIFHTSDCGKGIGSWAAGETCRFAFGMIHLKRLSLDVFSFNGRARKTYEKAGFRITDIDRGSVVDRGIPADDIIMTLTSDEWKKAHPYSGYSCETDKNFHIRHSHMEDLPEMLRIYEHARDFMARTGNPRQWGPTHWPPEDLLKEDIRVGRSYVVVSKQEKIVGTFVYVEGPHIEPTYENIDGAWLSEKLMGEEGNTYGVVHRVAGDGSQKGIGTAAIGWAYSQSHHIRIDTHPDNRVMQNLLCRLGFVQCGIIHVVEDNDPRCAYEKLPEDL